MEPAPAVTPIQKDSSQLLFLLEVPSILPEICTKLESLQAFPLGIRCTVEPYNRDNSDQSSKIGKALFYTLTMHSFLEETL